MNNLYCKDDIQRIFNREKILVGNNVVFPEYRAIEIFGLDAIDFVRYSEKSSGKLYYNAYGIGDYTLRYLTIGGLEIAATYVNISFIRDNMREGGTY